MSDSIRALQVGRAGDETAALVALLRSRIVSPAWRLSRFVEEVGSAVRLVQLSEEDRLFARDNPTHAFIGAVVEEDVREAQAELSRWQRRGLDHRTVLDPDYPRNLRTIFNRPPLLFIDGTWDESQDVTSVAVVGTRSATAGGLAAARQVSTGLVEAGFSVLSGMAEGIDTAAHEAALSAGGRTVAVMGTGVDHRYPATNAPLADRIIDSGGGLISHFFPGQGPRRWTFPERNVTMSGLALATVVVEAAATSGARMQARIALQHGRTVFLLQSLVDNHDWARKYVEEGVYETHAIAMMSTSEIVDRMKRPAVEPVRSIA